MTIRGVLKSGAARALWITGADKFFGSVPGDNGCPVVLGYHRVVADFASSAALSIPSMLVSCKMLERHLDWIGRRYRFIGLDELGEQIESRSFTGKPTAAVTFDDGYRDFYDHAFPMFQRKGIPAAVFVVTDLVGTNRVQAHDKLYLLLAQCDRARIRNSFKEIPIPNLAAMTPFQATRAILEMLPLAAIEELILRLESFQPVSEHTYDSFHSLSWEDLDTIRKAGFTVGSHTRNHVLLTNEAKGRLTDEVSGSRNLLQARLGTGVRHFAYPSGVFDRKSISAVAAAGYRFAYTACTHRSGEYPFLTIPRTLLWENSCLNFHRAFSGAMLSCQIHHTFGFVGGCRQRHALERR